MLGVRRLGNVEVGWVEGVEAGTSRVRLVCGLSEGDQGGPRPWAPGVREVEMYVGGYGVCANTGVALVSSHDALHWIWICLLFHHRQTYVRKIPFLG